MSSQQLHLLEEAIKYNSKKCVDITINNKEYINQIKFFSESVDNLVDSQEVNELIQVLKLDNDYLNNNYKKFISKNFKDFLNEFKSKDLELNFKNILCTVNQIPDDIISSEKNNQVKESLKYFKYLVELNYSYLNVICNYISKMTDNYAKLEYKHYI